MAVVVAVLACGAFGSANAAKGGAHKDTAPAASLYSSCDDTPCFAGDPVDFWGEGYDASQGQALLQIGSGLFTSVAVYSDGTVDFTWNYFQIPGQYSVQLYQNGKGHKLELKSETTVSIEP